MMSQASGELRLPDQSANRVLGRYEREAVFMNGLAIFRILLIIYTLSQIGSVLFLDLRGFLHVNVMLLSILIDIGTLVAVTATLSALHVQADDAPRARRVYRLMVFTVAVLLFNGLAHVHIVGSQNSMHQLLVVAVLLVASWFLRTRELLMFFVVGNVGLALIVTFECLGVLDYAPLMARNDVLREIFLDWRTVLGQSMNYVLVLSICSVLVWKARRALDLSERLRQAANQALRHEVDEHIRAEREKEELIVKLQASLDQVKVLHGLLPICMNCKKIRDDQGYWQKLESYLKSHSPEIEFSHGLCPDCIEELYPSDWEKESGEQQD